MIGRSDNLDQFYGSNQILFEVSLTIEEGCTGLLGNNGAGKSTLLKTLLGQLPLKIGRVELVGADPAQHPLLVRQRIGYMPESDVYLPGLSGLDFVAYCGELSGMHRVDAVARAHEVLHFVGLGEARYREVENYSTGMRQRAKLAACLVHGPRLLMLDEPTTGMDPQGREEMLHMISDLSQNRGVSVLYSSHILPDIEQTCDRIAVLHEGRVLFSGSRDQFQKQESRRLMVRVKRDIHILAQALEQAGCQVQAHKGQAYLEVKLTEQQDAGLIWAQARQHGLQIRHLASATDSLEQAYSRVVSNGQSRGRTP